MCDFDKLNRETQNWRNTCVDRFNPSAPNSTSFAAYCNNQGNRTCGGYGYTSGNPVKTGKGRYLGNGQYVED